MVQIFETCACLQNLFVEQGVHSGSVWEHVAAELVDEEDFRKIRDPNTRKRIFYAFVEEQKQEAAEAEVSKKAESEFRVLLRGKRFLFPLRNHGLQNLTIRPLRDQRHGRK